MELGNFFPYLAVVGNQVRCPLKFLTRDDKWKNSHYQRSKKNYPRKKRRDEFGVDEENYYSEPEDMFEEALKLINENGLTKKFEARAYDIVDQATSESWGHFDSLQERYEKIYGDFIR